jgi:hypothetical protein
MSDGRRVALNKQRIIYFTMEKGMRISSYGQIFFIHNQFDHILIDRPQHSSILDVRSFRGVDCNTDHYLVAAKVTERLAVSK